MTGALRLPVLDSKGHGHRPAEPLLRQKQQPAAPKGPNKEIDSLSLVEELAAERLAFHVPLVCLPQKAVAADFANVVPHRSGRKRRRASAATLWWTTTPAHCRFRTFYRNICLRTRRRPPMEAPARLLAYWSDGLLPPVKDWAERAEQSLAVLMLVCFRPLPAFHAVASWWSSQVVELSRQMGGSDEKAYVRALLSFLAVFASRDGTHTRVFPFKAPGSGLKWCVLKNYDGHTITACDWRYGHTFVCPAPPLRTRHLEYFMLQVANGIYFCHRHKELPCLQQSFSCGWQREGQRDQIKKQNNEGRKKEKGNKKSKDGHHVCTLELAPPRLETESDWLEAATRCTSPPLPCL
jgi:hypothetical protein